MVATSLRLMLLAGWNVPFASEPVRIPRAVELVDFCRELVSRLHVGNCVIRHSVDGLVGILCAVEDVDELVARA